MSSQYHVRVATTPALRAGFAALWILILGFFALEQANATSPTKGGQIEGKVVGVADGDTMTVLVAGNQTVKVRLAEIDAPEKSQAFGQVSRKSLSDLVYGKSVVVRVIDIDGYGRSVGRVFVGNLDVNLTQVQRGLAWAYDRYVKDAKITAAEKEARAKKIGVWSDPKPTPPWLFRRSGTKAQAPSQETIEQSVKELHSAIEAMIKASKEIRVKL